MSTAAGFQASGRRNSRPRAKRADNSAVALRCAPVFRFFLQWPRAGGYIPIVRLPLCRHPRFFIVGGAECVDRRRVSLSVPEFNLTAARTRLSDDMAFATLCFIRNLSDGLAGGEQFSNWRVNRKHPPYARAPSQQTESGCTSTNLTDGLRDCSTTSPVFTARCCGKPQRLSQATTNPADRQFTDRPVVAAQGNGTTHDR